MRKNVIKLLLVICLLCSVALAVAACKGVKMIISFVVDGETYATIDTSGNEIVTIPQSPAKDGYTFDGWYWDVGTWQRPFTANSLLNEPLTSNMSVYAKFSIIHNHDLTLQPAVKADCEHVGNDAYYTCTCGKMFADAQATEELTAVPTIDKTEHTPTDWIVDSKATCTQNGSKHTECSVCHTTLQTQAIPSNGHTPETEWIIDITATCTVDGSKHLECSVCHTTLQTDIIPATGHSYSTAWSKDKRGHWRVATCEHTGETTAIEPHTYDSNYKCKICGYQDTSLHGTAIATDVFTIDGETLYAKTPNTQTTFSFINAIQVADGATFVVATDLAASNVIRTKTVSLKIGDNIYYILVENGNDIQLYTVTLRRRPIYTVTFVTNGGTACESQQVEEDSFATEPITSKKGYTFANWDYDFATPVTQNTTITASWTANEYTVTYDVNGGVLTDTQYTATYDSAYTLAVPTREGHTFQGWYIDDTQITNTNGQSRTNWTYLENKTVTAKWTVNSYAISLTVNDNNAGTVLGSGKYQFGDSVTITSTTNDGYNFVGWFDIDDNLISTDPVYTFTVRGDVKYIAKYNYYTLTAYGYDNVRFSVGAEVTLNAPEPCIGYDWVGWYNGDELLTAGTTYTFTMPAKNLTYTAERKVWDEMSNFNFTSTLTTCIITGVIDKTVTEIVVPNYITSIGSSAFNGCSSLENITIPFVGASKDGTSNTHFGYIFGASSYSSNSSYVPSSLKMVVITGGTAIAADAFYSCSNITSITIPNSVTSIGSYAFNGCSKLANINYLGTIESWCKIQGLNYLMEYGTSSKTLVIKGKEITEDLVIPSTVTSIPSYAFSNTNITSITIPDSVIGIGSYAFSGCSELASINYLGTLESWCNIQGLTYLMGYGTSSKSLSLNGEPVTELVIPSTVTSIPSYAFSNTNITSITIPDSVIGIGSYAFSGCSSLANINYLGTIETWFNIQGLYNLMQYDTSSKTFSLNGEPVTELVIPNTVTSIPSYAFYKCTNITNVAIPNSVTSISFSAFFSCSNLETVYYEGDADQWDNISISSNNDILTSATRYYYSETEPELNADGTAYDGNYWHYGDNHEVVVWEYKKENN